MITQNIGGTQGVGNSSLATATYNIRGASGDTNADLLALGVTNGSGGATGFKVVIEGDASAGLFGTVAHVDGSDADVVTFNGFEQFSFTSFAPVAATNNDVVDATAVTSALTLDTGVGNDTVNFGSGNDTFVIGSKRFGNDTVNGGAGHDTMDLMSGVSGHLAASFTVSGTNLRQNTPLVATSGANSVAFTGFETIKTGAHADTFTNGYAATDLKSIEMGNGDDLFAWMTLNGDELDIDAGARNDTVNIGGNTGSARTGLIDGTVKGGTGTDKLALGVTNGHSGATGFKVTIEDDAESTKSFQGTVAYADGLDGPTATFTGFEALTFSQANVANNNDVVDATAATRNLTLDTGIGDDTVNFGSGNDTFVVGSKRFGNDTVDGGAGHDTMDLLSGVGGHLAASFTVSGTNFSQTKPLVATSGANSVSFTGFEAIKTGAHADTFTNGSAATVLETVDMGGGDDRFEWGTRTGHALDINAGSGNDFVRVGGSAGVGNTGLIDGTVDGGTGTDTLHIGYNNSNDAVSGNGFQVTFTGNNDGTVMNRGATTGPMVTFESFEAVTFDSFNRRSDLDDRVDARASNAALTIHTAAGDDTIIVGGGNDTVTGGLGDDTFAFFGKFGNDRVTDFKGDMLAFQTDVTGVTTDGNDTVIETADGTVTLDNVTGFDDTTIVSIIDATFDWA